MSPAADAPAAPEDFLVRRENGILIVTINRPEQGSAVNGAAFRERRDPKWQDR